MRADFQFLFFLFYSYYFPKITILRFFRHSRQLYVIIVVYNERINFLLKIDNSKIHKKSNKELKSIVIDNQQFRCNKNKDISKD